ncbi:LLM class F420-dependent oxidoreductase [Actinophytocola gossypii]|uniref:LLM class F420-dependent oxidoreductase n=1 Tax=Actinophytocola gossypii TaxID=2812003 RepID=A0ABT2J369_9PSEU|nr:LLM class F420-dependent oxidoreductase [Actinophytocola gossypii]MCT2582243.1 LLM class F420-dependent oxidoreductase [Actinophytocola gossypii]
MRIGMPLSYSGGITDVAARLRDYEAAGVDIVFVPEAYSYDSVSLLGYLAAATDRIGLATSVLNTYTRTPSLLAMTAAGLDHVSGGRFTLGIGASGPQVVEGFHGVPYRAPLGRAREVAGICRAVWRREEVRHDGTHFQVPLSAERGGSGQGKALKLINTPVRERIPMMLGAMGDKAVALAAELFEAWQPMFFLPEAADAVFGAGLGKGRASRDAALGELDVVAPSYLAVVDDADEEAAALSQVREHLALYVGGMGARGKNFYTDLVVRFGYEAEALRVQDLYLAGRRAEAAATVPEPLVRGLALVGSRAVVAERLAAFAAAGATTLNLRLLAAGHDRRLRDVEVVRSLVG